MCTDNNHSIILDSAIDLDSNSLLTLRPELLEEWDFAKNAELGLNVYKITKGSSKNAWWICSKCKSSYDVKIWQRGRGDNCPYCRGLRVNQTNSLASLRQDLASEWNYSKNGELTPNDVAINSGKKVWWIGRCGHEWEASIDNRNSKNRRCPYCSNQKVLIGFNDMWTTSFNIASKLASIEDGYNHTQNSNKKVDWICLECKTLIKNKEIQYINKKGLSCPICSDGISYPEKFMYCFLNQLRIPFKFNESFIWSHGRMYDFYLVRNNTIVETHGIQHYEEGFEGLGGRTLEEEVENDKYKNELAMENEIREYIIIDCRYSDFEYIKNNILNSRLAEMFNLDSINWFLCHEQSCKSFVKMSCDLFNTKQYSVKEIARIVGMDPSTIRKYLKQGSLVKWCNYDGNAEKKKSNLATAKKLRKEVVQFTIDGEYIREWVSLTDAAKATNTDVGRISNVCRGKRNHTGGFKWMYKADYENSILLNKECNSS